MLKRKEPQVKFPDNFQTRLTSHIPVHFALENVKTVRHILQLWAKRAKTPWALTNANVKTGIKKMK